MTSGELARSRIGSRPARMTSERGSYGRSRSPPDGPGTRDELASTIGGVAQASLGVWKWHRGAPMVPLKPGSRPRRHDTDPSRRSQKVCVAPSTVLTRAESALVNQGASEKNTCRKLGCLRSKSVTLYRKLHVELTAAAGAC